MDKPDLPFYDKRVRQALFMAINKQEIADTFYGGQAEILSWPTGPKISAFTEVFTPLEELPDSTRELFDYKPDAARQLLADAGYPDGFKTSILTTAASVDLLSIIKDYWDKIGVELVLDVKEYGAFVGLLYGSKEYDIVVGTVGSGIPFKFFKSLKGQTGNSSMLADPTHDEAFEEISAAFFDPATRNRLMKEFIPYMLEHAYVLQLPSPYVYMFWQPWIKGYQGEMMIGYHYSGGYVPYIWLDLDLKEEMTGRR